MKYLAALLFPLVTWAAPDNQTPWMLTDLSSTPELAAFFAGADAVITVKKNPGDSSDAIRPSILVFHLEDSPKKKLKTTPEWNAFIKPFIQDKQLLVLRQDISQSGRYIIEFTSRHHDSKSDLRSIYLVTQAQDNSVTLFIYDGLGPATARNLPRVRAFLQELDTFQLDEMYGDDIKRRATR